LCPPAAYVALEVTPDPDVVEPGVEAGDLLQQPVRSWGSSIPGVASWPEPGGGLVLDPRQRVQRFE
jgi:hypothetical protein